MIDSDSDRAGEVIEALGLLPLDRALLPAAGALSEPALRALDAIHVAAAVDLAPTDGFRHLRRAASGSCATGRTANHLARRLTNASGNRFRWASGYAGRRIDRPD